MSRLPLYLAFLTLAACSEQPDQTYTVTQLLAEKLLFERIETCRNNAGELGNTVNCMNTEAAHVRRRFPQMLHSLGG